MTDSVISFVAAFCTQYKPVGAKTSLLVHRTVIMTCKTLKSHFVSDYSMINPSYSTRPQLYMHMYEYCWRKHCVSIRKKWIVTRCKIDFNNTAIWYTDRRFVVLIRCPRFSELNNRAECYADFQHFCLSRIIRFDWHRMAIQGLQFSSRSTNDQYLLPYWLSSFLIAFWSRSHLIIVNNGMFKDEVFLFSHVMTEK